MNALADRHVHALVPGLVHERLHQLAYKSGRSMGDLVLDATILLLRYHEVADGLPEPLPPKASCTDTERGAR